MPSIKTDRKRMLQTDALNKIRANIRATEKMDVYLSDTSDSHNRGILCALVPANETDNVLSSPGWHFDYLQGKPSAVRRYSGESYSTKYLRFGTERGIEPLVIDRDFYGMRDNYRELCEEFRLFHRLYHDRKMDEYIKINDDGTEYVVASVEPRRIRIRLKEIRQFLAIKEMYLSIQFDFKEYSTHTVEQLQLGNEREDKRQGLTRWTLYQDNYQHSFGDNASFSRLLGVHLIEPLPKEKSGLWGFAEDKKEQYADFIIDVDECGDEITHTANPDTLANFFGANPNAPQYLTPVHFRKEVLDKYYQQPGKYSVDDSALGCGNLWGVCIDNHHANKVCAWLGDLGRDMPYEEQLHWRSHNITPEGSVSDVYFKRQMEVQFTESEQVELLFKQRYHELSKECEKHLKWQILKPLDADDSHYFQCIRLPATDEQKTFDELTLALTKVLIDSLNEKYLNKLVAREKREEIKGSILKLQIALENCGRRDAESHISFLRQLQSLRSSSVAHRKSKNYRKVAAAFGVESQSLRHVFNGILSKALAFLDYLLLVVRDHSLNS